MLFQPVHRADPKGPQHGGNMEQTEELKVAAREAGADLVGVADLGPFKAEQCVLPANILERFTKAVSIAIHLADAIVDGIDRAPTPDYARHYREVNAALDTVTARLVKWINQRGFSAFGVPASQIVDNTNLLGSISHKAVARMAGIGWQGKSLLIVSPQYGPRIRLSTLLTDMPLSADTPLKNRCGTCAECTKACPASAIKNVGTNDRYESREDALCLGRCVEQTLRFKACPDIGAQVCGVCVKVCPFGKRNRAKFPTSTASQSLRQQA
jgi:epoxyqueuosine reductase QueG